MSIHGRIRDAEREARLSGLMPTAIVLGIEAEELLALELGVGARVTTLDGLPVIVDYTVSPMDVTVKGVG